MLYTVPEVASKLHVSNQSIYAKLKRNEYKDKTVLKHGQTFIDDQLYKLIYDNMKVANKFVNDVDSEIPEQSQNTQYITLDDESTNINQELFNLLRSQLEIKDNQLEEKDNQLKENNLQFNNQLVAKDLQINNLNGRLKQEQELNKNNQILLLRQPQDIKVLESHFQDLDIKLEEVKEKMQEKKQDKEPKGFLSKLFNKK
jgi:hypothetical protein